MDRAGDPHELHRPVSSDPQDKCGCSELPDTLMRAEKGGVAVHTGLWGERTQKAMYLSPSVGWSLEASRQCLVSRALGALVAPHQRDFAHLWR